MLRITATHHHHHQRHAKHIAGFYYFIAIHVDIVIPIYNSRYNTHYASATTSQAKRTNEYGIE